MTTLIRGQSICYTEAFCLARRSPLAIWQSRLAKGVVLEPDATFPLIRWNNGDVVRETLTDIQSAEPANTLFDVKVIL